MSEPAPVESLSLAGIWAYPLKGAGGVELSGAVLDELGIPGDRRWMLVTEEGGFISQRTHPRLALLTVSVVEGVPGGSGDEGARSLPTFRVEAPGLEPRVLEVPEASSRRMPVKVHRDRFEAQPVGDGPDEWFSSFLGGSCHLVFFSPDIRRPTDPAYAPGHRTAFTDGYPLHLVTVESLREVNRRVERTMIVERFRPNLVVEGGSPWEEDEWRVLEVGEARLELVKPCARCSVTLVDPASAGVGLEPLAALSRFRAWDGKVFFGQNAVVGRPGSFETGSSVRIVGRGERRPPILPRGAPGSG